MKKVRFGVVGTSGITEWFLQAAKNVEEFELVSVYSRSIEKAEQFAKKHGAKKFFDNLEEMSSDSDIDAVYIASPNFMHKEQAITCMNNKKAVLCEKAFASNAKEAKEMIECAKKNDVLLMEEMRLTCTPNFRNIKKNLDKIGTIRRYSANFCQYSSRYDNFKKGIIENAFKPELSNGALMDIGVYCIHPLVALFGKPDRIHADATKLHTGVDGQGVAIMSYDSGILADIRYSKITKSDVPSEIQGEDGSIIIDGISRMSGVKIAYRNGDSESLEIPINIGETDRYEIESLYCVAREFVGLVLEGKKESSLNTHANTIAVMEIMDEIRRQIGLVFPADEK